MNECYEAYKTGNVSKKCHEVLKEFAETKYNTYNTLRVDILDKKNDPQKISKQCARTLEFLQSYQKEHKLGLKFQTRSDEMCCFITAKQTAESLGAIKRRKTRYMITRNDIYLFGLE